MLLQSFVEADDKVSLNGGTNEDRFLNFYINYEHFKQLLYRGSSK